MIIWGYVSRMSSTNKTQVFRFKQLPFRFSAFTLLSWTWAATQEKHGSRLHRLEPHFKKNNSEMSQKVCYFNRLEKNTSIPNC